MKPLTGLRVIELARILAGPWCGQLLADLGAEVIKIERPGQGDDTRDWGPPFVKDANGSNLGAAYYHATNRGKTSLSIDIASFDGQARVRELIADADIVIENYKVGGLKRYGLDYCTLSAFNSRLVYCSVTGFGQDGPYASRAGYDFIVQGMGGFMSLNGDPSTPPQKAGVAYADVFTGVYAAVGILAAIRRRDVTGMGGHIDLALLDTQMSVLANQALNWMVSGEPPVQSGNAHPNLAPYQTFATSNGDLIIAVGNDEQFRKLCDVLHVPFAHDPRFATNPARVVNRAALALALGEEIEKWTKETLSDALECVGVPAGPINRIDEAFANPQVVHRGLAIEVDGIPGVACPIVIDGERMIASGCSPRLA